MRRKGQGPFTKRGMANKNANKSNIVGDKKFEMNTIDSDGENDFMYNSMRQVVSDGMNHITKTFMGSGGYDDGTQILGQESGDFNVDSIGDLVNSMGELQTRGQENIPLRPLVMNNNIMNATHNVSPNRYECNAYFRIDCNR